MGGGSLGVPIGTRAVSGAANGSYLFDGLLFGYFGVNREVRKADIFTKRR
jgi:hypothetical protein